MFVIEDGVDMCLQVGHGDPQWVEGTEQFAAVPCICREHSDGVKRKSILKQIKSNQIKNIKNRQCTFERKEN